MEQTTHRSLTRRTLLAGGAAALAAAPIVSTMPVAHAAAAKVGKQAPYFYRFTLGGMEATIVSDGPVELPSATFGGAVPKEVVEKMLTDSFLPADKIAFEQNILVLNTGSKLVMFDTGLGSAKLFGPSSGRMLVSMREAGIDPKDIDAVVISHAHPDHLWGVMADDGKPNFPNAQIYINQVEYDFWTDLSGPAASNATIKPMIEGAHKHLTPNRDRIVFIKDGQEFLPGIQAVATPGHTVGHNMFVVTASGKSLALVGDTTHHPVLLLQNPRIEFAYDTDPKQGVQSRIRALDMVASSRIPLLSYHFPWPGIAHISKNGDGYRYHPAPLQMVL